MATSNTTLNPKKRIDFNALTIRVRDELNGRRGDWRYIADSAGVSYSWLSQFSRDLIPNPGVGTLQKVVDAIGVRK